MTPFRFDEARCCVIETVRASGRQPEIETVPLSQSPGRVLARAMASDRDYPPVARSIRDGFAVRAEELPGTLRVIGEVRAGMTFAGSLGSGQAIEIMTGAPVPAGADAIVMVEHAEREGDRIRPLRPVKSGDFINPQGAETRAGSNVLSSGIRLDFAHAGLLATIGSTAVPVFKQPRVAIVATGDEIVPIEHTPLDHQIRNSNSHMLEAQVRRSGGVPDVLPIARDEYEHTREMILRGLEADLLLLSGGVSAGKYDIVENVLAGLGAEFYFTRVLIQPGQPLVFGRVQGKFFFGLPGNPASTAVTFELFARAALELLSGIAEPALPVVMARLTREFRHKNGLTRFLPARLSSGIAEVTPVPWQGSSDMIALAGANAFLIAREDRESWEPGDTIEVLAR